jgi:hypothetical protein
MQPIKPPGLNPNRPHSATMGDFNDRLAMDMLPEESLPEAEEIAVGFFRRRSLVLMGAAGLIFWAVVIVALIAVF